MPGYLEVVKGVEGLSTNATEVRAARPFTSDQDRLIRDGIGPELPVISVTPPVEN